MMTLGLAQQFGFLENKTHLSFAVPFSSPHVVFEVSSASFVLLCLGGFLTSSNESVDPSGYSGVVHQEQTGRGTEEFRNQQNDTRILTGLRLLHIADWFGKKLGTKSDFCFISY